MKYIKKRSILRVAEFPGESGTEFVMHERVHSPGSVNNIKPLEW